MDTGGADHHHDGVAGQLGLEPVRQTPAGLIEECEALRVHAAVPPKRERTGLQDYPGTLCPAPKPLLEDVPGSAPHMRPEPRQADSKTPQPTPGRPP